MLVVSVVGSSTTSSSSSVMEHFLPPHTTSNDFVFRCLESNRVENSPTTKGKTTVPRRGPRKGRLDRGGARIESNAIIIGNRVPHSTE